jgi:Ca2+-binding RTX toxin-like protein
MANPVLNLSSLNGSNGFVINGINQGDRSGRSVSNAGDINGDGIDDLIIGATDADPNGQGGAGSSYVVFGTKSGFNASLDLSSLNGSNGFVINGINRGDLSGNSVSSAGDINGDGIDDLIIGAYRASPNGQNYAGSSYVVFGTKSGLSASLDLSSLNGSNGFVINGINQGDRSGTSVSSAGDINGDGIDDLIIGASSADPNGQNYAGSSYVVFGRSSGLSASLDLSSLDGSNGFVINGINSRDFLGGSVSSAGDINGDGIDDLIIGARYASRNGQNSPGSSYVVFGTNSVFSASLDLSSLNGSNGFVINGINQGDLSGTSVSSAGDINGDGIDDLIIGAFGADPNGQLDAGSSYVVFGRSSGFGAGFDLSSLDGSEGFVINGINAGDNSGTSVSSAGDINGDGFDDLIIGARYADPNGQERAGSSYVVFGTNSGFGAGFNLSSLDGSEGFVINGINAGDNSGTSVSSAGDVNGDGFDDLIIGARYADPNGQPGAGSSYVVFGFASPTVNNTATTDEDTAVNISVLANDSNSLTVTAVNGTTIVVGTAITLSSGALVTLNADGTFTYDPNAQFNALAVGESGTDSFTYAISDGSGLTNTASVSLSINGVNDAPSVSALNLSDLNGSNGFVINGINRYDRSGTSVSGAGDINGDGIDDLIIGAPGADPNGQTLAGESYVVFGSNSGFGSRLNLSSLNGSNGFVINGINGFDNSGSTVSSAGDFNGDGFDDLIIGTSGTSPNARLDRGRQSYVVFGSNSGFGSRLNLSSLNGGNGFVINATTNTFRGADSSVSSAGDVNGDGFDDLIIRVLSPFSSTSSYVVFGSNSGFGASFNLSSLNGGNGFVINNDNSGSFASSAGDINGDGFDDLIINKSSQNYVVFGTNSGFSASLDLSDLNGSNGFVINSINAGDFSGSSVSNAGDINGDGIDDLIIGARNAGSSYVVFGTNSGFSASFDLSSLDGSNGFVINGINAGDFSGSSVSNAGDINGDGFDDLIIGARYASPNGQFRAGSSYVVFGTNSGFSASLDLSSLDGSNGFVINGINSLDYSGRSISSAGDINGDGFDDLIIGASGASPNGQVDAGSSYVVFGFATAATTNEDTAVNILASNILRKYSDVDDILSINSFTNPTNGTLALNDNSTTDNPSDDFFIYTPNTNFNGTDSFNFTVSDGNGGSIDGSFNFNVKPINDAPVAVNDSVTTAFNTAVNIKASTLLANDTDVDSTNLSITGVNGATQGTAVLNDNGTQDNSADDFILFTPIAGFSGNANFNYTISDRSLTSTASVAIAVSPNTTGTLRNETISGTSGNDTLTGDAGNDTISGDAGNDTISGGAGNDTISGGSGNDTLTGDAGNDTISGGSGNDTIFGSSGNDTLTGGSGNDTISGGSGNDTLTGGSGNDTLTGGNGNDLLVGGIGKDTLTGGNGSDQFFLASKEGIDIITDFSKGTDLIALSGGLSFAQLSFAGNNILVTSTLEIWATLTGINTTTLTSSDFTI